MLGVFIQEQLPGYAIGPVEGDGMCMLHAFHKGINNTLKEDTTLDEIAVNLRKEILLNNQKYQSFSDKAVNVLVELEKFLSDPLKYNNSDTYDLFLIALGKAYYVNIVAYESNSKKCWIKDYTNKRRRSKFRLYFAKTLSEHIDPILPLSVSGDIAITGFVPGVHPETEQEDNISDDDSVIIIEEPSSSVTVVSTQVKSKYGNSFFFFYFHFEIR